MTLFFDETVALGQRSYPVSIGHDCLGDRTWWSAHCPWQTVAIVSNTVVAPLYLSALSTTLSAMGRRVIPIVIDDGEEHKTQATLDRLYDALLAAHCPRDACIVALGGGVVGDIAGFAAATYQRGIAFIQVPTTLLAQVDSSVGGKTAINHARGKNMIGAFHQPRAVLIDVAVLNTLAAREFAAGMAEVIKHGAIADAHYLASIAQNWDLIAARDAHTLAAMVRRSVRIKADIVSADEREQGVRAHLNFGHTFAHAIEAGLGYGRWLHGEAVAAGMAMASDLSVRLGMLGPQQRQALIDTLVLAQLPVKAPTLAHERWHALMALDKKVAGGQIRFVVLEDIGRASVRTAPVDLVDQVLHAATTQPTAARETT